MSTASTIQLARKIVHAPEAFSKKVVREAVQFIKNSTQADEEDLFWADADDNDPMFKDGFGGHVEGARAGIIEALGGMNAEAV